MESIEIDGILVLWTNNGSRIFDVAKPVTTTIAERCAVGEVARKGDVDIFADQLWLNQTITARQSVVERDQ